MLSPAKLSELYRLVFIENLSNDVVLSKMRLKAMEISEKELRDFRKNALTLVDKKEVGTYLLDSIEQVKIDFEDLVQKTKGLIERAEQTKDEQLLLSALAENRQQLALAMKRLGELTDKVTNVTNIKTDSINVTNIGAALSELLTTMNAEEIDGKIVLNSPSPELLIDLRRNKNNLNKRDVIDGEFERVKG